MNLKLLFLPLSIGIALFSFIYFTKPTWDDYSETKKNLEKSETDLGVIENSRDKVNKALVVYEQMDLDNKFLLKNAVPENLQEENFLKEIDNIILDSGIKVTEISVAPVKKTKEEENLSNDSFVESIQISMLLAGNYFGLKRSLYLIENMNRFVKVEGFVVKEADELENLELNLDLILFHKENNNKLGFSSNSSYFKSLLTNGLNLEVLDEYKNYREKVIDFTPIESHEKGTDNLFDFSGGSVESIKSVEESSEQIIIENQDQNSAENIANEELE